MVSSIKHDTLATEAYLKCIQDVILLTLSLVKILAVLILRRFSRYQNRGMKILILEKMLRPRLYPAFNIIYAKCVG